MEGIKMPFIPEETLRTQRVEVYLNDLKARLKQLRHQHDEVIQHSVDIINEIDSVSSSLLLPPNVEENNDQITRIKKLIQEFETVKNTSPKACTSSPVGVEGTVDIRKILDNFEKLNESHVLKESLVLFKRAKESFEKIDTFFEKLPNNGNDGSGSKSNNANVKIGGSGASPSLKLKINLFNGKHNLNADDPSYYASCCSSISSLENNFSSDYLEKEKHEPAAQIIHTSNHNTERGYEGDNDDSEYDLFPSKKKKLKTPPQNM